RALLGEVEADVVAGGQVQRAIAAHRRRDVVAAIEQLREDRERLVAPAAAELQRRQRVTVVGGGLVAAAEDAQHGQRALGLAGLAQLFAQRAQGRRGAGGVELARDLKVGFQARARAAARRLGALGRLAARAAVAAEAGQRGV